MNSGLMRSCMLAVLFLWSGYTARAAADELREPPVISSEGGVLDLLMVVRPGALPELGTPAPSGWIYEICRRPAWDADHCPNDMTDATRYGGTRLALSPGDLLKIHLVNRLPPLADSDHAAEPGEEFLALNPTNIHFHGMLVSPHGPSAEDPTWGDNVFVLTFNPANGTPTISPHVHATVRMGFTDYTIQVPPNHPPGLYWFHPHAHGISLNQVTAGLAGIVTVGSVDSYVCLDPACMRRNASPPVRHLILKDTQILPNGAVQDQLDPGFCDTQDGTPPPGIPGGNGCIGQNTQFEGGPDYRGGRWIFSVNGQLKSKITVAAPAGQIWRILNASGSVTYDLSVVDAASGRPLMVQVVSVDGISISPPPGTSLSTMATTGAGKFEPRPCPGLVPGRFPDRIAEPVCTTRLHMMPSSRVEIWVTYRDATGKPVCPPAGARAILRTNGYQTGPAGDNWPAADLAAVRFVPGPGRMAEFIGVHGDAKAIMVPSALSTDLRAANRDIGHDPSCHALAQGHRRRIFFNAPTDNPDAFGLGYEELDARGNPVPGTFMDVKPFDPMRPTICLPLGPNNTSVKETWELVNLAGEDHNFHIHQVHFRVVSAEELAGTAVPTRVLGDGFSVDSVPLVHADGVCNSVDDWRAGRCTAHASIVEIPFAIAGDFVYHCHILEHEDGGMMARIRVRPSY